MNYDYYMMDLTLLETQNALLASQLDKMKTIINDWADMKIKSFKDRRSWVRNPDDIE